MKIVDGEIIPEVKYFIIFLIFYFICIILSTLLLVAPNEAPNKTWMFFSYLANFDLRARGWNFVGLLWFGICGLYTVKMLYSYFRIKYYESRKIKLLITALFIAPFPLYLYQGLLDEMGIFTFIFTRFDILGALSGFFWITQKYIRWLLLLPLSAMMTYKYARGAMVWKRFIFIAIFSVAMFVIQVTTQTYDIRALEEPTRTWAFTLAYIPMYIIWGIGYWKMWKRRIPTSEELSKLKAKVERMKKENLERETNANKT